MVTVSAPSHSTPLVHWFPLNSITLRETEFEPRHMRKNLQDLQCIISSLNLWLSLPMNYKIIQPHSIKGVKFRVER